MLANRDSHPGDARQFEDRSSHSLGQSLKQLKLFLRTHSVDDLEELAIVDGLLHAVGPTRSPGVGFDLHIRRVVTAHGSLFRGHSMITAKLHFMETNSIQGSPIAFRRG